MSLYVNNFLDCKIWIIVIIPTSKYLGLSWQAVYLRTNLLSITKSDTIFQTLNFMTMEQFFNCI